MLNTENEGLVLSGLMAEHSDIMYKILNTNIESPKHNQKMKMLEKQLTRIEACVFKILDYEVLSS